MCSGYCDRPPTPRKPQEIPSSKESGRHESDDRSEDNEDVPLGVYRNPSEPMSIRSLDSGDTLVPYIDHSKAMSASTSIASGTQ